MKKNPLNKKIIGTVYLVGAGPGDPGLFTLKGRDCLKNADVVLYDHLVNPSILSFAPKDAEMISVGKNQGNHPVPQDRINALLVEKAKAGNTVVRLKGGDPFLFGRGGEEALELSKNDVPFKIVPGVTSAIAVPAYAGIPVTHRKDSSVLHIVTGHEDPAKTRSLVDWGKVVGPHSTTVVLMGMNNLEEIVKKIISKNPENAKLPSAVIQNGTFSTQRIVTSSLDQIAQKVRDHGLVPPGILVIGDVAALRKELAWFDSLKGLNVLVTRPIYKDDALVPQLVGRGARVSHLPLIKIVHERGPVLKDTLSQLKEFDWIVFTSQNSVRFFYDAVKKDRSNLAILKKADIAVIGSKTAQSLREHGLKVSLMPEEFTQEALAKEFTSKVRSQKNILLVQTSEAPQNLYMKLREKGHSVNKLSLYKTLPAEKNFRKIKDLILKGKIDVITLTSASCAKSLGMIFNKGQAKKMGSKVVLASIGPVSTQAARQLGFKVAVNAKEFTSMGLCEALADFYRSKKGYS